jgi:hypothetical protein
MRLTLCLFIVSLSILFLSCSSAQTSNLFKNEYMPLAIGNKWIYSFPKSSVVETVVEVVSIDTIEGKEYFVIKNSNISHDTTREYINYKRISNDTLYSLIYSRPRNLYFELIEAIFSLDSNDIAFINTDITSDFIDENNSEILSVKYKSSIFNIDSLNSNKNKEGKTLPVPIIKNYSIRVINKSENTIEFFIKYGGLYNEVTRTYRKGIGFIPSNGKLLKYKLK